MAGSRRGIGSGAHEWRAWRRLGLVAVVAAALIGALVPTQPVAAAPARPEVAAGPALSAPRASHHASGYSAASDRARPSSKAREARGSAGGTTAGAYEDPGAVSCVSVSFCAAVGYYVIPNVSTETFIQMWNGTKWSVVSSPNVSAQNNRLFSVSCASTSFCMAVGFYTGNAQASQTLVEQWNGSTWSVVTSPDTSSTDDDILYSVSCPTPSFCAAAGNWDTGTSVTQTLIENWSAGQWQIRATPNVGSQQYNWLRGVSCSAAASCMATGMVNTTAGLQTLVLNWNGTSWSLISSPNNGSTGSLLVGVSCVTSSFCVAVGDYEQTSGNEQTLIETWNGTAWGIASSPNVGSLADQLVGVSCISTTSCDAIGNYQAASPYPFDTLIESWNGTVWSVVSSPNPSTVENLLNGVSCVSASFCSGVGDYIIAGTIESLFEQWNGSAWSLQSGLSVPQLLAVGGVPGLNENPAGGTPGEPGLCPAQGNGGDPCNTESGVFYETFTDLAIPGRGPAIDFTHTYSTANAATAGPLGFGWTYSYSASVALSGVSPNQVATVSQENGSQVTFLQPTSGSAWAPAVPRTIATLNHNADGTWTFTRQATLIFTFNQSGQLVSEKDLNGYTTSLGYTSGELTSITDAAARSLQITWTGSHITSISDTAVTPNRTLAFQYNDGAGNLTDVIDVNGGHSHFVYDGSHRMTNMYDPNCYAAGAACNTGHGTVNVYNSSGKVQSQQDQLGRTTTFAYSGDPTSASGGTTTITDPVGNVNVDFYQFAVRTAETRGYGTPQAATTTYRYDPTTLAMTAVGDPNGHMLVQSVDGSGNVTGSQDALGRTTAATYNSLNEPLTKTDGNTVVTTYTYDASGNLKTVSTPLVGAGQSKVTTYTYGDSSHPGDVTAMTDPDTKTWHYAYDSYGDQATVTDPLGDVGTTCFNADGWRLATYTPKAGAITCAVPPPSSSYETTYSYVQPNGQTDEFGDVQTVTDPLGHATKTTYDADRNVISSTDGGGNLTKFTFDLANERTDVIRADQSDQHTDYNLDGTVHDQKDGKGNAIQTYGYDSLARVTSAADALGNGTTYTYDAAGKQLTKQDPGGNCSATPATGCTTMAYDADNELSSVTYSDGVTPSVHNVTYDSDGQRTGMADGTGTSTWSWDSLHRLTSYTDGNGDQVKYQYNLRGLVTQLTYPGNLNVTQGYDDAGRLASVQDWLQNTTTFGYDANSNETTETLPASTNFKDTFVYDVANNVNLIADAQGSNAPSGFEYTRDNNNQLATTVTAGVTQPNESYGYTPLNQLKTVNSGTYSYDGADNITGLTSGTSLSYNAADEITTMTQGGTVTTATYDPKGELTSLATPSGTASTTTFGHDQAGRLSSYSPPQWTSVVAGYYHTLALRADGAVWAWGDNSHGELGNGTTTASATPQVVSSLTGVTAIAAGGYHSLALKSDGTVWTWGDNLDGDLGNGTTTQSAVPVQVQGLSGVIAIAAGQAHSLALKSGGTMVAWGNNRSGQLGDPNISLQSTTPVPVSGLTGVSAIASGDIHSLAVSSGSVWAWGDNSDGQLGSGQTQQNGYTPVQVPGISNATAVAGGGRFSMARESDGSVWAWGYNADGELGNGTTTTSSTATKVIGIPAVSSIAAGYFQGLALDSTEPPGTSNVWAWGGNSQGALGNGTTQSSATPVHVQGPGGVQAIAGGGLHTEALGNSQTLWGWGRDNEGEVGDGDIDSTTTPVMLGTNATYTYNGDGLRMTKTAPLGTAHYTWDASGATPLLLSDGSTRYIYGPGGLPVEQIDASSNVTWLHHDELGSTRLLTDPHGNITGTYSYDAYGNVSGRTGSATTALLYAAQYRDSESALYYMRARYYDPVIAQFLSRDPAVSTTREPYAYVAGNPLNGTDPNGLDCGFFSWACDAWSATTNWFGHNWQGVLTGVGIGLGVLSLATGVGALLLPEEAALLGLSASGLGTVATVSGLTGAAADVPGCFGQHDALACAAGLLDFAGAGIGGVSLLLSGSEGFASFLAGFGLNVGVAGFTIDLFNALRELVGALRGSLVELTAVRSFGSGC